MRQQPSLPYPNLAHALATARERAGIATQSELASVLGVTQQSVSRWEAGSHRPRPVQLAALASILALRTADLVVLAGYEQPAVESLASSLPVDRLDAFTFELFTAALAKCVFPGSMVRRVGEQGHAQGGADIAVDLPDGKRIDLQCKRVSRFGPGEVRRAVAAHKRASDKKIIVLSRVASPQAAEEVSRHPDWGLWDKDDLTRMFRHDLSAADQASVVDVFFRHHRRALLGRDELGAWLTAETFFRPFASRRKPLSHEWRLVGRDRELASLLSASAAAPACLLVGAGGIGKSRLLKEFAARVAEAEPATVLRFLDRDSDPTRADLEALGPGPKYIIVDDGHDRERLGLLFAFASTAEDQARLVVATRPYAAERIRRDAAAYSVTDMPTVLLGAVDRPGLVALAEEVLAEHGSNLSWAGEIVDQSGASPLATALFARGAARDGSPPELARASADVRDLTASKFAGVLLGELGHGKNANLNRDVLEIVALVQPFHPEDPGLLKLLNDLKDIRPAAAERSIRELIEGGVIFRRGGRHRLMPDLLGDYLVEKSCVDAAGGLSRFARDALGAMPPALLPNALVNLGRLDWRRSGGDPVGGQLLAEVWASFASIKEEGDPRLEAAKRVAVYQPRQALDLVGRLIRRTRLSPSLADILRGVAHHHEHLQGACDLLWRLGRDDTRELGPHPGHPLRILSEAAGYAPHKPRRHNEEVLAFALKLMDDPANWRGAHTPLTLLEPLTRLEGETTRSTARVLTFTPFKMNYDAVRPIRETIIGRVLELLGYPDIVVARRAACFLQPLLHGPIGIFDTAPSPDLVLACEAEFCRTLRGVGRKISGNVSPAVLLVIARTVAGLARRGAGPVAREARAVLRRVPDSLDFRVLAALGNGSGIYLRDRDPDLWHAELQTWLAGVAAELRQAHPGQERCRSALEAGIRTLVDAGEDVSAHQLAVPLLDKDSDLQRAIVEDALARPDSLTRGCVGIAIAMLFSGDPKEGRALARRLLDSGDESLARAVTGAYHNLPGRPSAEDVAIMRRLMASGPGVVPDAAGAVASWRDAGPEERIGLLLEARVDSVAVADRLAMVVGGTDPSLLDHLRPGDAERILAWLEPLPALDGFWVDGLLSKLSYRFPFEVAGFLMRRVERASATGSYRFRAANSGPYGHTRLRFLDCPEAQAILDRVWAWLLDSQERDHVFRHAAAGVFEAMFLHDVDKVVELFDGRVASAEEGELRMMGTVLHNADSEFVFSRFAFVERLLERREELDPGSANRATGDFFASALSGVHSGVPGEPMPKDLQLRDLAAGVMERLSRASAAYPLYQAIHENACRNISRALAEGEELDAG